MKKQKSVLFICNYFAPDSTIAAVRTTKLVKYLREYGYNVDFIKANNSNLSTDEILVKEAIGINVIHAYNSNTQKWIEHIIKEMLSQVRYKRMSDMSNRERVNPKTGNVEFYPFETAYPLMGSIDYIMNMYKQKDLFKSIKTLLKEAKSYDYLITSYGDAFCYYAGMYYHKKHPETKWIFDIRDAIYRYKFTPKYVSYIPKMMERNVWKKADVITGISNGICARVPRKYRRKVYKITNGYDLSDRFGIQKELLSKDKLIMTFTGSMYGGLQNLSPLFRAISEHTDVGDIEKNGIEFHFAGTESASSVFRSQLAKYGLDNLMIDHGKMNRSDTLLLQNQSDVLLTPSYDFEDNKGGILTGKFFEYMSAEKPLIVVVTGDIKNSEIASITRKCSIGVAYEQSNHKEDYYKLKSYVLELYNEKKKKGYISFEGNRNELKKYNYRYVTKKLVNVMEMEV